MDHFDRIFEAGRGSESGANGSSEEDSGGLLRGAKPEDPFKLKKAGPPDFEFVSNKWFTLEDTRRGGIIVNVYSQKWNEGGGTWGNEVSSSLF